MKSKTRIFLMMAFLVICSGVFAQRSTSWGGNYTQWKFEDTSRTKKENGLNVDLSNTSKLVTYPNPAHNFIQLKVHHPEILLRLLTFRVNQ